VVEVIEVKPSLLIALGLLFCVTTSFAENLPGSICVYADEAGTDCNIVDDGGLVQVHMLHVRTNGALASQFALDVSATNWTHIGDLWSFYLSIGSSVGGVALAYEACLSGSIHLGMATFFGSSAPPCTEISIVPDPGTPSGKIKAADCSEEIFYPTGGLAYINPDPTCQCSVPVSETTWGKVKSLYR
jgi:hypothetical protein